LYFQVACVMVTSRQAATCWPASVYRQFAPAAVLTRSLPLHKSMAVGEAQSHCEKTPPHRTQHFIRSCGLQFGVYVGVDLAAQIDFFKRRGYPFHNWLLLR
jgi:hypothetical protein